MEFLILIVKMYFVCLSLLVVIIGVIVLLVIYGPFPPKMTPEAFGAFVIAGCLVVITFIGGCQYLIKL